MSIFEAGNDSFKVVVNDEGHHSIWPAGREAPAGWRAAGKGGTKEECLAHIKELWTDMRPLGLQKRMAAEVSR